MPNHIYKGVFSMDFDFQTKLEGDKELGISIVKYQPCYQVNKYIYTGQRLTSIQYFKK